MRPRWPIAPLPLTLAALLAGCAPALTEPPAASTISPPAEWRTSLPTSGEIDARWWTGFGDSDLSRLVELARANNVDVAIAASRVAEARAQEQISRALLLPTLDASAPASHGRSLNAFGIAGVNSVAQPGFQASYELDLSGRNSATVAAARANAASVAAAREATLLSVSAATASSYLTLTALDERLSLLHDTMKARTEERRIARDRFAAGYTSRLELSQAEAQYQSTQQQIPAVESAIALQEHALSQLVGETPRAIPRGQFDALQLPAVPAVLPSELLRRRPDIAQAEYLLAASDARMRAARALFLPQVRLSATAGGVFSSALSDPVGLWAIGGSVLAPIFEGGRLRGQYAATAAQRDQAAFGYRRTVLIAFRETEDQLALIARLGEQERALSAQRTAVAETLRHATNRYRSGYSPYLEQIDAQRALLAVDIALIDVRNDRLRAHVALYQATGGAPAS